MSHDIETNELVFADCHGRRLRVGHSIPAESCPVVMVGGVAFTDVEARMLVTAINDQRRLITNPMMLEARSRCR